MYPYIEKHFVDDASEVVDVERLRRAFKGQGQQFVIAAVFFALLAAGSLIAAALSPVGSDTNLLWMAGVFSALIAAALRWFYRTDPLTAFWRDPDSFRVIPASIDDAQWVAGARQGSAGVKAMASYRPLGANTMLIETRFSLAGWPFVFSKGGVPVTAGVKGEPLIPLPVNAWVLHKIGAPQVSFLAAVERPA